MTVIQPVQRMPAYACMYACVYTIGSNHCQRLERLSICYIMYVPTLLLVVIVMLFRGWYCEIPLITEGVYMQIEQAEQMGQGA